MSELESESPPQGLVGGELKGELGFGGSPHRLFGGQFWGFVHACFSSGSGKGIWGGVVGGGFGRSDSRRDLEGSGGRPGRGVPLLK